MAVFDYIYTDVSSCETTLICLPVISKNNENVEKLEKEETHENNNLRRNR